MLSCYKSGECFTVYSMRNDTEDSASICINAIHHRMAHPTGMAHFVANPPLYLNILTPQ